MLLIIIAAFFFGGFIGFFMACLLCSGKTMERNESFPERFYRNPLHSAPGRFSAK